jgi:hypothetical protein
LWPKKQPCHETVPNQELSLIALEEMNDRESAWLGEKPPASGCVLIVVVE